MAGYQLVLHDLEVKSVCTRGCLPVTVVGKLGLWIWCDRADNYKYSIGSDIFGVGRVLDL